MDAALQWLRLIGDGVLHALAQPYYYIAVIIIGFLYMRGTWIERRLFSVRLHVWPILLIRTIVAGLAVGVVLSGISVLIGAQLTAEAAMWLWGTAAILALLRLRYLCFAYAAGVLGILQWLNTFVHLEDGSGWINERAASLAAIDMPAVLLLVALLHGAEALLVRRQGTKFATPMFMEGKRGKLIGAYQLQGYWAVPLLLLVPTGSDGAALDWTPLLPLLSGEHASSGSWSFTALPMVIGFTEWTRSQLPENKARLAAKSLLWYSAAVAVAALAAAWLPSLLPVAAIAALLLHELLIWSSAKRESEGTPLFVHDQRGLMVLGVVPGTPAAQMGLQSGEILHKVNGVRVRTKEELYEALHRNSAFCKLEVLNREGEQRFVQRSRYAGEHHQLGVILAPDDKADFYAEPSPGSFIALLWRSRATKRRELNYGSGSLAAREQAAALALPAASEVVVESLPEGGTGDTSADRVSDETLSAKTEAEPSTPLRRSKR
ncbi:PDZ domain-containing protein [Paenibacillus cellulosilyticus]|uniref:PDZ domain-containing protein n=1 Tax=Paenibacillus cellulosilyticus TaxID=375489 RepID=A0A2V2Z3B1_9BACL|nr:PDZ domain-containing protein [Paenibacillus cellulosilyticus]PWW08300.1 PDZ domain-containing protein [Paenibacillus cellulosilyticus]QKS47900.1 PDZ domain-containing protein [Paenibacillus cellulosilyticus]